MVNQPSGLPFTLLSSWRSPIPSRFSHGQLRVLFTLDFPRCLCLLPLAQKMFLYPQVIPYVRLCQLLLLMTEKLRQNGGSLRRGEPNHLSATAGGLSLASDTTSTECVCCLCVQLTTCCLLGPEKCISGKKGVNGPSCGSFVTSGLSSAGELLTWCHTFPWPNPPGPVIAHLFGVAVIGDSDFAA